MGKFNKICHINISFLLLGGYIMCVLEIYALSCHVILGYLDKHIGTVVYFTCHVIMTFLLLNGYLMWVLGIYAVFCLVTLVYFDKTY